MDNSMSSSSSTSLPDSDSVVGSNVGSSVVPSGKRETSRGGREAGNRIRSRKSYRNNSKRRRRRRGRRRGARGRGNGRFRGGSRQSFNALSQNEKRSKRKRRRRRNRRGRLLGDRGTARSQLPNSAQSESTNYQSAVGLTPSVPPTSMIMNKSQPSKDYLSMASLNKLDGSAQTRSFNTPPTKITDSSCPSLSSPMPKDNL